MKLIYWLLIVLVLGLAGAGIYFYQKNNQPTTTIISPLAETDEPAPTEFSVETAPSETLRGTIATMSGEIKWQARTATEAAALKSPITIQQGEKLVTGEASQLSLAFAQAVTLTLQEKSELEIIQTLPGHIVFNQISGTVRYVKSGADPISIRTKHLLVENNGNILIAIDPEEPIITLKQTSGQTRAAYNDLDFISQILEIETKDTLTFNDDTRRAVLR